MKKGKDSSIVRIGQVTLIYPGADPKIFEEMCNRTASAMEKKNV